MPTNYTSWTDEALNQEIVAKLPEMAVGWAVTPWFCSESEMLRVVNAMFKRGYNFDLSQHEYRPFVYRVQFGSTKDGIIEFCHRDAARAIIIGALLMLDHAEEGQTCPKRAAIGFDI